MALLVGYGAGAINPYLAHEALGMMIDEHLLEGVTLEQAVDQYNQAAVKGVVKAMSKMGICTIDSYRGAQIFEAVGIAQDVIDRYFTFTASRVGGIGMQEIARESAVRHAAGVRRTRASQMRLSIRAGQYRWREDGEAHVLSPLVVYSLQTACRTGDYAAFKRYSALANHQTPDACTLRSLLEFKPVRPPVPLDEVEPVEAIVRRFKTGGMSYGSISQEAHEALAIAMNRAGWEKQHRRGWGGSRALHTSAERRQPLQRHQAGRLRPLWGHQRVPGQRPGDPDQDGAGRQAGRGRAVARPQSLSMDRHACAIRHRALG